MLLVVAVVCSITATFARQLGIGMMWTVRSYEFVETAVSIVVRVRDGPRFEVCRFPSNSAQAKSLHNVHHAASTFINALDNMQALPCLQLDLDGGVQTLDRHAQAVTVYISPQVIWLWDV